MKKKIIIILLTTLVVGAVANGVMNSIGYDLEQYHEQLRRRGSRRTRLGRKYQHPQIM